MISMRKNAELFFILEMLLLTPVALFWIGLASMFLGSSDLLLAVIGEPLSLLRIVFAAVLCPGAAAWFAFDYIIENKKEKGGLPEIAKVIIAVCLATIALVVLYYFTGGFA